MNPPKGSWNGWSTSRFFCWLLQMLFLPISCVLMRPWTRHLWDPYPCCPEKKGRLTRMHSSIVFHNLCSSCIRLCSYSCSYSRMERKFLKTTMAKSTMGALECVHHLNRADKIQKQNAATALLRDTVQKRSFATQIAARATKAIGPIGRHLTAQILLWMSDVSRASRPGLAVGILRVLCNGMCSAQRFHMDGEEQRCRAHYNACLFSLQLRHCCLQECCSYPRRGHLVYDVITQIFLKCFQYGIVLMGVIDAFVFAQSHHRRNVDNPGKFGDCMDGRFRFVTAITPTYAHATIQSLSGGTFPCDSPSEISLTCGQSHISAFFQFSDHNTRRRQ